MFVHCKLLHFIFVNKIHCDERMEHATIKNEEFKLYFEYLSHSELIEQLDIHIYIKPELYRKSSAKTFRHIFSFFCQTYI